MPIQAGGGTNGVTIQPGDWTGTLSNNLTGVNLTIGVGTEYLIQELKGWKSFGASPLGGAAQLAPKQLRNGSWKIPHYYPYRDVTMTVVTQRVANDVNSWASIVQKLEAATQPDPNNLTTLAIQLDGVSKTITGSVILRDCPTDFGYQFGWCAVQIVFRTHDPRLLGTALAATTGLPSSSGGLTWPVTWPISWNSTVTSGQVSLTNSGTAVGPLTVRINGPVTGPQVSAQGGGTVAFSNSLTVNSGDFLLIDMEAQSALYNGQASRAAYMTQAGWFGFQPGANQYVFSSTGAYNSAASAVFTGTPAWI